MAFVIAAPCADCKDGSCIEVCPVDCIHWGILEENGKRFDQMFINPDDCIDCGMCEPQCPVDAIYPEDELPEIWREYQSINARFYQCR